MAPEVRSKLGTPMFEPEVFRKHTHCIEVSTCNIFGTFRRPCGDLAPHIDSAPGELRPLAPPGYAPAQSRRPRHTLSLIPINQGLQTQVLPVLYFDMQNVTSKLGSVRHKLLKNARNSHCRFWPFTEHTWELSCHTFLTKFQKTTTTANKREKFLYFPLGCYLVTHLRLATKFW